MSVRHYQTTLQGKHLCFIQECPNKVDRLGDLCETHAARISGAVNYLNLYHSSNSPPPVGRVSQFFISRLHRIYRLKRRLDWGNFTVGLLAGLAAAWVYVMIWDQVTQ